MPRKKKVMEKEINNAEPPKIPRHKLYATAETLFIDNGMTCIDISARLDIPEQTLSRWRKTMEWDKRRSQLAVAPNVIRQKLTDEIKRISEGHDPSIDADALSKAAKALQYFNGTISLPVIVSVFKDFDNYMASVDPKTAVLFTRFHKQYIAAVKEREYGNS